MNCIALKNLIPHIESGDCLGAAQASRVLQ